MTQNQFSKLKKGDTVKLNVTCDVYGSYFQRKDGNTDKRARMPAGRVGTVAAVRVPSVYRDNVYFHCVDFPHDELPHLSNPHKNNYRVAIIASDDAELI